MVFSACANGGVEKCDIAAIENNFDVVYGMCTEFKFKTPNTGKLIQMIQDVDEEHFECSLLTRTTSSIMERKTIYRYQVLENQHAEGLVPRYVRS